MIDPDYYGWADEAVGEAFVVCLCAVLAMAAVLVGFIWWLL